MKTTPDNRSANASSPARPIVLAMMGLPGSGKTTLAKAILDQWKVSFLSRDDIREAMFKPCHYTDEEKSAAYEALLIALRQCLRLGRSAIIDGMSFSRAQEVVEIRKIVEDEQAVVKFVYLDIPVEIASARIADSLRAGHQGPADRTANLSRVVAERSEAPPDDALILDACLSAQILTLRVLEELPQLSDSSLSSQKLSNGIVAGVGAFQSSSKPRVRPRKKS